MTNFLIAFFIISSCCSINTYNSEIAKVKYEFLSDVVDDPSSEEENFDENEVFNNENFLPISMFDYFNNLSTKVILL